MHVCMHVYMHACMHTCIHACMYVWMYKYIPSCFVLAQLLQIVTGDTAPRRRLSINATNARRTNGCQRHRALLRNRWQKFSKVSSLVNFPYEIATELTDMSEICCSQCAMRGWLPAAPQPAAEWCWTSSENRSVIISHWVHEDYTYIDRSWSAWHA